MTAGGTCYHCGEWVACVPEIVRELGYGTARNGRWDPATRRWTCFACVPETVPPLPAPNASFEPDLEHQRRELASLGLRKRAARSGKDRGALDEMKELRRESQPWRRR